jgi:sulfatase modifying factor 1
MARRLQCRPPMRMPARLSVVAALLSAAAFGCSSAHESAPAPSAASATASTSPPTTQSCVGCLGAPTATTSATPPAPAKQKDGQGCGTSDDCESGVCTDSICQAPTPTDGVKNGDETDVDCGGPSAPRCAAGLGCAHASDCTSAACGSDAKCQVAPSCTGGVGAGKSCGPNGESCCASARVPAAGDAVDYSVATWGLNAHVSAFRLDKYEVTVGRVRAFFNAMGGNPQANFEATMGAGAGANKHVAGSGWQSSWNKRLPASWGDIDSRYGDPALTPNGTQFCMRGASGDYGTSTWTHDADGNAVLADNFDEKPIVCIDWYTMFAFCAWDGGRLPTSVEWGAAAGDDQGYQYAWGNDPMSASNVVTALNGFAPWPNFTWGLSYRTPGDRGTHVAPVGEKQATRYGIYDLAGNAAEWLLDSHVPTGDCADCADISDWKDPVLAWPHPEATLGAGDPTWKDGGYRVVRGGTWEGHDVSNVKGTWNGIEVGFTYHALGGRCARDL